MKKVIWFVVAMLAMFVVYNWLFATRRTACGIGPGPFAVSPVEHGMFTEFIPQAGIVSYDTVKKTAIVKVSIDELYLSRIVGGLKATTMVDNTDYTLEITNVYPTVTAGRFSVDMVFKGEAPPDLADGKPLLLRIVLSNSVKALLLSVGGFYKDTGGEWVYVLEGEGEHRAAKRRVKLGRKNTDYFEVLGGLTEDDRVITSSYENIGDKEWIDLDDVNRKMHRFIY